MYNHVIGVRAEEGQQKKKEVCIQTEEQRSRSFIRGKKESQAEIATGGEVGEEGAQEEEEEMPVDVRCDSIAARGFARSSGRSSTGTVEIKAWHVARRSD